MKLVEVYSVFICFLPSILCNPIDSYTIASSDISAIENPSEYDVKVLYLVPEVSEDTNLMNEQEIDLQDGLDEMETLSDSVNTRNKRQIGYGWHHHHRPRYYGGYGGYGHYPRYGHHHYGRRHYPHYRYY